MSLLSFHLSPVTAKQTGTSDVMVVTKIPCHHHHHHQPAGVQRIYLPLTSSGSCLQSSSRSSPPSLLSSIFHPIPHPFVGRIRHVSKFHFSPNVGRMSSTCACSLIHKVRFPSLSVTSIIFPSMVLSADPRLPFEGPLRQSVTLFNLDNALNFARAPREVILAEKDNKYCISFTFRTTLQQQ